MEALLGVRLAPVAQPIDDDRLLRLMVNNPPFEQAPALPPKQLSGDQPPDTDETSNAADGAEVAAAIAADEVQATSACEEDTVFADDGPDSPQDAVERDEDALPTIGLKMQTEEQPAAGEPKPSQPAVLADGEPAETQYLVKWRGQGHINNEWVPEAWLQAIAPAAYVLFCLFFV